VGGGPAGAFAAEKLARAGRDILLFDEKLAWEKPCGGGLTHKAITRWPFLRDAPVERNWISHCELIAPSGRRTSFQLDRQIAIFSRTTLNGLLLERARQAGAGVICERVLNIERSGSGWNLHSAAGSYDADFVIVATGARNSLRSNLLPPLGPENFMVAAGYYIPGTHHRVQIRFVNELHGYIWIFPRADHLAAGICGRMQGTSMAELRKLLEGWLRDQRISLDGARFYAHIIPSLTADSLRNVSFAGEGWAIIGDAAGFVDAITGEGIFYALCSAELLAGALLADSPETYPALIRQDFLGELQRAARIANRFYAGSWMGGAVIERMVHLTALSPRFRDLMRDLFAGSQQYSDLRKRVYRSLPTIVAEGMVSVVAIGRRAHVPCHSEPL
jgi:flavin-dependent dehydrogenase